MAIFTTNDAVQLNFHTYGQAENQALVLISGYSASEVTWVCQAEALAAAGFFVVTYDHRAHGQSQKVSYGLTLARLATDLQELLRHLQLKKPILVGHSMGAATILAYEELFTDVNVAAVVTEDQAPLFLKQADWLDGKYGHDWDDLPQFMIDFPKTRLTRKKLSDDVKRALGKAMYPFDFKAGQPLLRNIITQDLRSNLTRETVPHLFLAGSLSPIFPAEHTQAARQLQPHPLSEVQIFEGCGHLLHLEEADKFNQTVFDFWRKIQQNQAL